MPDVRYMAVIDQRGQAVAHSDPPKIDKPFDSSRKITHLGPHQHENWELVTLNSGQRIFEVHRHFRFSMQPLIAVRVIFYKLV